MAGVSLMLRLLWASLRWDDMAVKPSAAVGTTRTGTFLPSRYTCSTQRVLYTVCYIIVIIVIVMFFYPITFLNHYLFLLPVYPVELRTKIKTYNNDDGKIQVR